MFAYILDITDEKRQMAEQTAKTLGCVVRYLSADKVKKEDTIEKWLANFRDAKYVITDSYHGTVFSLIFQKEFCCFYNKYRGNARMDSIKEICGLEDRFVNEAQKSKGIEIDHVKIDERINIMRNKSLDFLMNLLSPDHKNCG